MDDFDVSFRKLVDAEDYFRFFDIPFDSRIVSVNRLHILGKFGRLCAELERTWPPGAPAEKRKKDLKEALVKAYETFLARTPQEERLFKVFQKGEGEVNVTFHSGGSAPGS
ncbi:MAG: nitrogenase-stabilizing/protective protein NifW [Leptospirales bacterium]